VDVECGESEGGESDGLNRSGIKPQAARAELRAAVRTGRVGSKVVHDGCTLYGVDSVCATLAADAGDQSSMFW
jgi:hypothetical protein